MKYSCHLRNVWTTYLIVYPCFLKLPSQEHRNRKMKRAPCEHIRHVVERNALNINMMSTYMLTTNRFVLFKVWNAINLMEMNHEKQQHVLWCKISHVEYHGCWQCSDYTLMNLVSWHGNMLKLSNKPPVYTSVERMKGIFLFNCKNILADALTYTSNITLYECWGN